MSNHIRTCGACGQAIGVGSSAVYKIRKATEKRVIDEIFEYIKILEKKHTYESEPDYELCGFQQPESYVAYSRVFEELKQKYGVKDE